MTKEDVITIIDRLYDETMFLNAKYDLYMFIDNKKSTNIDILNKTPGFWGLILDSLLTDIYMTTSRIYEKENRSDKNIYKLLNLVLQNIKVIPENSVYLNGVCCNYKYINELIQNYFRELDSKKEIIERIFVWRDKFFAHLDNKYFLNPKKIESDFPVKFIEIKDLIILLDKILNELLALFAEKNREIKMTHALDIDLLFNYLDKNKNEYLK